MPNDLVEFCYYFHYCKNLRFDDKPDYAMLRNMFLELLMQNTPINTEFTFDWFQEDEEENEDFNENIISKR
jgi:casein kinase I family protein HRR25